MYVVPVDPLIFCIWVSLPFDQVLHFTLSAIFSQLEDFLNLILFFPIDKVRRWFRKVWSVELGLMIRGQEVCVEDVMYLPLWQKFQLISDRR